MRNKILFFLILGIVALCPQIALGDEIIVEGAETVWNLALDDSSDVEQLVGEPGVMVTEYADTFVHYLLEDTTDIQNLVGEPGVMVTEYADTFVHYLLEDTTDIQNLVGEPGVMVTKYADTFVHYLLEDTIDIQNLVGEPGVMVTKYADAFKYEKLTAPPFIQSFGYFDTGEGTYPCISGTHNGTITPSIDITVNTLYTYSCSGTGGHTESVRIYNATETLATGNWEGYKSGDYQNITFPDQFTLIGDQTYNYTIRTGSYPQIIHAPSKEVTGGTITCTRFTDANGHIYNNWIPAIRLDCK